MREGEPACASCAWWAEKAREHRPDIRRNVCRRFPPTGPNGRFAETLPDDWCGEYRDKDGI